MSSNRARRYPPKISRVLAPIKLSDPLDQIRKMYEKKIIALPPAKYPPQQKPITIQKQQKSSKLFLPPLAQQQTQRSSRTTLAPIQQQQQRSNRTILPPFKQQKFQITQALSTMTQQQSKDLLHALDKIEQNRPDLKFALKYHGHPHLTRVIQHIVSRDQSKQPALIQQVRSILKTKYAPITQALGAVSQQESKDLLQALDRIEQKRPVLKFMLKYNPDSHPHMTHIVQRILNADQSKQPAVIQQVRKVLKKNYAQ